MFCKFCGKEISDDAEICGFCGRFLADKLSDSNRTYSLHIQRDGRKIGIGEVLGIAIAILGILAIFYCGSSIREDMIPHGFAGIRANYQSPFSTYEKLQILKLVASILAFISGIALWAVGRNFPDYTVQVIIFIVIVMIAVFLIAIYISKNGEDNYRVQFLRVNYFRLYAFIHNIVQIWEI